MKTQLNYPLTNLIRNLVAAGLVAVRVMIPCPKKRHHTPHTAHTPNNTVHSP